MNDLLIYFLKVNIAIALFYLFYRLFFASDTFWRTRRYYLLFSVLVSFLYPLLSIENWLQKQEPVQIFVANYTMLQKFTVTPNQEPTKNYEMILYVLYGLVVIGLLIKLFVQLFSILKFRIKGENKTIQNVRIIAINKEITPFSFFGSIYMNPTLHTELETTQILAHELTHVRQAHSIDVLISELLCIAFWINPAVWLLKREFRQNLEFLADDKVIESGFDTKSYQYHLLQLAYQTPDNKLVNKFNISPLKKRITMMNQQKTRKAGLLKYSLIVPLSLTLVFSSNTRDLIAATKSFVNPQTIGVWKNKTHVNGKFLNDIPEDLKIIIKGRAIFPDKGSARNAEVIVMRGNTGDIYHTDDEGYFNVQMIRGGTLRIYGTDSKGLNYMNVVSYSVDMHSVEVALNPIKHTTKQNNVKRL